MNEFKEGDLVVRIDGRWPRCRLPTKIKQVDLTSGSVWFHEQEVDGSWDAFRFVLWDEPSPQRVDQHAPGAKLDTGKIRPGLVLGGFARALKGVSEVGTFGAAKYTDNGWTEVPNGEARYEDAQLRHWLDSKAGIPTDPESKLIHLKHEAWNALARLDLYLRNEEKNATS